MPFDVIKKNVYFDPPDEYPHSSRNHAEDLRDFHVPMHRMHNVAAHGRGVAAGLEVSGAPGATEVVIDPGVAVDGTGQTIVLAHPTGNQGTSGHGDISPMAPGDQAPVAVPVHLPLGNMAGKTAFVTIQFSEILDPNEGSGGRRVQTPWLRLQPTTGAGAYVDDGNSVILAIAAINAAGYLTSLRESDGALAFGRVTLGIPTSEVRVRRSLNTADKLQETKSGTLRAGVGGGLELTVPNPGDSVAVMRENGGMLNNFEVRANSVTCKDASGREVVKIDANHAWLRIGAQGNEGDLIILDQRGNEGLAFDGSAASLDVGTNQNAGHLYMRNAAAARTLSLDGAAGSVNANRLAPFSSNVIDVNAAFFRIHGLDLVLDGRSGGNKRALVDMNNRLDVNFAGDYANGVNITNLHLADHVRFGYWEGFDTSKRPIYNQWIPLIEVQTSLPGNVWDFVTMCTVGMLDDGEVGNFWWGVENVSGPGANGDIAIRWNVNYNDRGDDWRPWKWNVSMVAIRR